MKWPEQDRLIIDKIAEGSEMSAKKLIATAKAMVAEGKGLLAMDESTPTCNKRFEKVGIPQTEETRRSYRELIVTSPGLGEFISGVILYDGTIRQSRKDGTPFVKVITDAGRARCNSAARLGQYRTEMENNVDSRAR